MRRRLVASAILAILLSAPLGLAAPPLLAAEPTDSERAASALHYLWAAQRPDGSIDGSIGETADFVFGTAAAGFDPATLRTCGGTGALDFLAAASDAAAADAAKTGKAVLAVVAAGLDPSSFQGRNLVARIDALYHAGSGTYGDGSTFAQAFAILGLRVSGGSAGSAGGVAPEAIAHLKSLQGSDGSWSYGTSAPSAGEGDTNSTAVALMALAVAGDHSADAAALAYLHSQQLADGGFPYQNPSLWGPAASDPDSDSVVIQALLAAGQDPEAPSWLQGSNSVLTHLRSTQGADGGFSYPGMGESAFTTSQVPAALVRLPYGAAATFTAGRSLAPITCSTPTPSPTVKPTAKPTVRPTVRPTARPTVRPTVRPTATVEAVSTATSQATDEPTAEMTPAEAAPTAEPSPVEVPGATAEAGSDGGLPMAAYLGAAAFGMLVVAGAGWILLSWGGRR